MNETNQAQPHLERLGETLRDRPSIADAVMEAIDVQSHQQPEPTRHHYWRTAAALAVAATTLFAVGVWLSTPRSLYAQTVAALRNVQTVNATGWTTDFTRRWPLEKSNPSQQPERYRFEGWYWYDDETPHSFESFGPVTQFRDGDLMQEYQQDADLLYISETRPKDYVDRFASLDNYLRLLKEEGSKLESIGKRQIEGRDAQGLRLIEEGRTTEIWLESESRLPVQFSSTVSDDDQQRSFELSFRFNQRVPEKVTRYEPPATKNVRYGYGSENVSIVWSRHVQDIEQRLEDQPLNEQVALLQRPDDRRFAFQYRKQTSDGKHWVVPLERDQHFPLDVPHFLRLHVQKNDGERAPELWRVPEELQEMTFPRADVVYRDGTPWEDWVQFSLNQIGLEFVDVTENRTYWIAEHDGREFAPWQQVEPPVPYLVKGGKVQRGVVRPGIGFKLNPVMMHTLLEDFNAIQNQSLGADHPIIIDETGLPKPPKFDKAEYSSWAEYSEAVNLDQYYVATDSPWFSGEESRAMARRWFKEQFGITFREETRPTTIHVVQKRK